MPAARIIGTPAAEFDSAVTHVVTTLSFLAKSIVFQLQHSRERKRVVRSRHIDIFRLTPGIRPQDFLCIVTGDGRNRPGLIVHIRTRLAAAADNAPYLYWRMAQVARTFGTRDDNRIRVVRLHTAIK